MLLIGSTVIISWKDNFHEDVRIDIYKNGVYTPKTIFDTVSESESYQWVIPAYSIQKSQSGRFTSS